MRHFTLGLNEVWYNSMPKMVEFLNCVKFYLIFTHVFYKNAQVSIVGNNIEVETDYKIYKGNIY
jgi:hypothetical protein